MNYSANMWRQATRSKDMRRARNFRLKKVLQVARLRWIERWKIERLADYFATSPAAIKERLRTIKKRPFDISVPISSGVIRGR